MMRDDVEEARLSCPLRPPVSEPVSVVLRLRGICDTSDSGRRRVGNVRSAVCRPGSRVVKPKSEVYVSLSEGIVKDGDRGGCDTIDTSGVPESYVLRRRTVREAAMGGAEGDASRDPTIR